MQVVDILINARWIIPVEPAGVVHKDYAMAVQHGRILALLPQDEAVARYEPRSRVDLPSHALLPGLVNAHTHAAMTLFRGLADDLPLMEWLNKYIWPAERAWVGADFVRDGTELAVAEMLRSGTTCFNDMYFFPDVTAQVAAEVGIRAVVGLIIIDFPTVWAADSQEYLHKGLQVHDELASSPLITTAFAPHAPYTVSDSAFEHVAVLAEELDIPIHMHVHETEAEIRESLAQHGVRPVGRLQRLGLISPRLLAVHMTQVLPAELELFAQASAHVVHTPESNLKLASGFCPVQRFTDAGVNVALGTDGAASNNDLNMLGEMRTVALVAKAVAQDAAAIPAAHALRMATLHGARALGLEEEIGSLLPGKAADAVAVDLGGLQCLPVYQPTSQLVYTGGHERVSDVWVAGRHLLKRCQPTTLDLDEVAAKTRAWGERIGRGASAG